MKTALVLSGGGMFGAYQAGAWKALSRAIKPDIVVGTSVGALNGWCIAGGATPEELERHWLDPAAGEIMTYRSQRSMWGGVFDPRPLEARAKLLVRQYAPRCDFGVVLARLPWLRPQLVRDGEVTWRHLVATCSVPVGFPPVRIGGKLYCDGGLLEPTPLWAGVAMGATRVIAVNASRFIAPQAVGIMIKGLRRWRSFTTPVIAKGGPEVVMITPNREFGRFIDGAAWRRENIRRWIAMGEADAMAAMTG
jgi:NTE family protein